MRIDFNKDAEISLYNRDFDPARNELNARLQSVIAEMIAKDLNSGSVTLKIDIGTKSVIANDPDAPTGERPAMLLEIEADVSSVIQQKEKAKCAVAVAGQKELVMDSDGRVFMVSPQEASGQLSMFNSWDEYREALQDG